MRAAHPVPTGRNPRDGAAPVARRAHQLAGRAAGPSPTFTPWCCRSAASGLLAFHASRWALGVSRSFGLARCSARRPSGGVSGPSRAALKTYRKFEQDRVLLRCPACVVSRLILYTCVPTDA
jgi:hypothetical protein